jgi:beta-mannosidase
MGSNWAEFVANSQKYQADLIKFAIEQYRRVKYNKVGSFFHFLFDDCWPSVTWSVVSYDRKPKPGYFALQRAYQPVLVGADLSKTVWSKGKNIPKDAAVFGGASVWVVNDEHRTIEGVTCEARLRGQGKDVPVGGSSPVASFLGGFKSMATLPADSVIELGWLGFDMPADLAPGAYELVLILKQGDRSLSENTYPVTVVE